MRYKITLYPIKSILFVFHQELGMTANLILTTEDGTCRRYHEYIVWHFTAVVRHFIAAHISINSFLKLYLCVCLPLHVPTTR